MLPATELIAINTALYPNVPKLDITASFAPTAIPNVSKSRYITYVITFETISGFIFARNNIPIITPSINIPTILNISALLG